MTDGLTDLWNRRHFMQLLEKECARALRYGYPLSVLMIDLDHFKLVNDRYGHAVGDRVLQMLACVGGAIIRDMDSFGRVGG